MSLEIINRLWASLQSKSKIGISHMDHCEDIWKEGNENREDNCAQEEAAKRSHWLVVCIRDRRDGKMSLDSRLQRGPLQQAQAAC
jgi:hypothetical protein